MKRKYLQSIDTMLIKFRCYRFENKTIVPDDMDKIMSL